MSSIYVYRFKLFNVVLINISHRGLKSPVGLDKHLPAHGSPVLFDGLDEGGLGGMSKSFSM